MSDIRRPERPAKRNVRLTYWSVLALCCASFSAFLWFYMGCTTTGGISPVRLARAQSAPLPDASSKSLIQKRQVFPYSVIEGGAYTPEELARARRTDAVVAAHYASFGAAPVIHRAASDLLVYVSYRKRDRIFWTKTRRRVPRGETLLVSGSHMARARCGNQLSFEPQSAAETVEPDEDVLDSPRAADETFPSLPLPKQPDLAEPEPAEVYLPSAPKGAQSSAVSPNTTVPLAGYPRLVTPLAVAGVPQQTVAVTPAGLTASALPVATGVSPVATPIGTASPSETISLPFVPPASAIPEPDFSKIMLPLAGLCLAILRLRKSGCRK